VPLAPGEVLSFSVDPRALCPDGAALVEGASIEAHFGWPKQTRRVWRKGGFVEEPVPETAPFVARRAPSPESPSGSESPSAPTSASPGPSPSPAPVAPAASPAPGLKAFGAPAFLLDATYPLEAVRPLRIGEPPSGAAGEAPDGAGDQADDGRPPSPLALTVAPLGATADPDAQVVTVTVRNRSPRSLTLFLRRELITYVVTGPYGAATCRMHPADRAPDRAQFSTLSPGETRSLTTRLPEACPAGTFGVPGTYAVAARLDARDDGSAHGLSAFVGAITTERAARLVIKAPAGARRAPTTLRRSRR
jgi:hypothetical protein